MVTGAMVLETIVKWLIPALCVALVGFIASKLIKPWKTGNQANQQAQWDQCMLNSSIPQTMCEKTYEKLKEESNKEDKKLAEKIDKMCDKIDENNKVTEKYHKKVDEQMDLIQQGVLDAHLQNLIATCKQYIRRGYILDAEFETYKARYELYKALGGNGHMDYWHAKMQALPREEIKAQPTTQIPIIAPPKTHL